MNTQLTPSQLNSYQAILPNDDPAQDAIAVLKDHNGDIEASFEELYFQQHSSIPDFPDKSLWEVTLNQLSQELCGDDSFRTKVQEYSKNPGSTPLLTGLIVYLVGLAGLPLDPAIATVVVLYILKIGLNIFCQYTIQNPPIPNHYRVSRGALRYNE